MGQRSGGGPARGLVKSRLTKLKLKISVCRAVLFYLRNRIFMKKRYIYLSWLVLCGWLLAVNGCGFKDLATPSSQGPAHTITDLAGREVVLPQSVARVVAIGPGALRFYCCINGAHNLVGVENLEKTNPVGRPYCLAHPSLGTLPVIGSGGPQNTPDLEKLMVAKPEVIFSTYTGDTAAIKALQAKTGIPVVALSYGQAGLFDPAIVASLTLIGKILGQEQKAEALTTYLKFAQQDLSSRTEKTPQAQKPNVYIGALGAKGAHGIESTQGCHAPFIAINAENVVDSTGKIGSVMIDKEQLIAWNPEVIFP